MKVLLVEDNPGDALLLRELLDDVPDNDVTLTHVERFGDALPALANDAHDLVLLDLSLPDSLGLESLWRLRQEMNGIPVVIFTSSDDEQVASTALKSGAQDYVVKGGLDGTAILRILRYAIDRHHTHARLQRLAHHDSLTQLPNRALFEDRLDSSLAGARRRDNLVAVHFLDLDGFKQINDTQSHQVGDVVLRAVAERLNQTIRTTDTVARFGGDEFAVIQTDIDEPQAAAVLAQKLLDAVQQPIEIEGRTAAVGVTIGIALFPRDGDGASKLLHHADLALYEGKAASGGAYRFFDADMGAAIRAEKKLDHDLAASLDRDEFVVHYQPQIQIGTWRIAGIEALVRWRHPERGFVRADEFVPTAIKNGTIESVGQWVFHTALTQLRAWQSLWSPPMTLALNLSSYELLHGDVVESIAHALNDSGVDPVLVEIEVDDGLLSSIDATKLKTVLNRLADLGLRIAVDDFGTGEGSLMQLRRLPISTVKIDCSLVDGIGTSAEDEALVKAVASLGRSSRLRVVAEGVETDQQLGFLRDAGCNYVQGFYFGPAVPGELMTSRLEEQQDSTLIAV